MNNSLSINYLYKDISFFNMLTNLKNFFGYENKENRNISEYIPPMALNYGGIYASFGAMNLSAAYRSIELISDGIAMLPIQIKKLNSKGKNNYLFNHYLNLLFDNDNKQMSKYLLIKQLIQSVLVRGNGFAIIDRAKNGTPINLQFIDASDVVINYDKFNGTLNYTCSQISALPIDPSNMIHLRKNTYDGINGISVLTFAKRSLDLASNVENSASDFYGKGGNVSGILKVNTNLNKEQREQILSTWNQSFTNSNTSIAVLQGNMDFQKLSLNAEETQMLQTRQYNVSDIARFFGINPILLGQKDSTSYTTLEMVQSDFLIHTLMPYISMIEEEFKLKLNPDKNVKIEFDVNYLLKTTKQTEASYYSTLVSSGIMTVNEVRKELGLSELEGGDKLTMAFTDVNQNTIADASKSDEVNSNNEEKN